MSDPKLDLGGVYFIPLVKYATIEITLCYLNVAAVIISGIIITQHTACSLHPNKAF